MPRSPALDPQEIERAWLLLRTAAERFDRIARREGWPTPFDPIRYLILNKLEQATAYGLSARRLTHALAMPRSSLAYHLDCLERAGFVRREPWTIYDRRKVAVRLTEAGRQAASSLSAHPFEPAISSPAMAIP